MASLEAPAYEVRSSKLHGRGLFATTNIMKGAKILSEAPLVAMQSPPNRHEAARCSCCLGTLPLPPREHLELLVGSLTPQTVAKAPEKHGAVGCKQSCGELYCSALCRDRAWNKEGHSLLCVGFVSEADAPNHPLVQFKVHAITTNDILLLVGTVIAKMVLRYESAERPEGADFKTYAPGPFAPFVQPSWWECAQPPPGSDVRYRTLCYPCSLLLTSRWIVCFTLC